MDKTDSLSKPKIGLIDVGTIKTEPPEQMNDSAPAAGAIFKNQSASFSNSFFKNENGVCTPKIPYLAQLLKGEVTIEVCKIKEVEKKQLAPSVIKKETFEEDEEIEVAVTCEGLSSSGDEDDEDSNGWDDFGQERAIDYICRNCGTIFQSSSRGEYYYCQDCKPAGENDGLELSAESAMVPPQHYAKYTCRNCGVEFYSRIGDYSLCEVCSGLNPLFPTVDLLSLTAAKPFSWGYTKKQCRVCHHDFFNRLEDWFYCPKCVASSSSFAKVKKRAKKFNKSNKAVVKSLMGAPVDQPSTQTLLSVSEKDKDAYSVKKEPGTVSENVKDIASKRTQADECKNVTTVKLETEVEDKPLNGEMKENHVNMDKGISTSFPSIPFKFILYACKLCKKPFYSNLADCFFCYACCNTNSISKRSRKKCTPDVAEVAESDDERKMEEMRDQEAVKQEKYDKYRCKVCDKEFYSSVGEWDFCNECNAMASGVGVSRVRNKIVNSFVRKNITFLRYVCKVCQNYFFSSREDQECCKKCTRMMSFTTGSSSSATLVEKSRQSSDEENREDKWENVVYAKYICKVCDKPFYSKVGEYYFCSECNPETKAAAREDKKKFGCAHCNYETHLKKELRKHLLTLPRDRKRTCYCSQCYRTALPLAEGETQEAIVYKCKRCDYSTKHKKRLKMHKNFVHKGKVPLYACKHCKFRTCHKGRLKCHIMTRHEGLKVYECQQCQYTTRQSGRLSVHIAVVHQGETPYPCTECDSRFGTRAALNAHLASEHESVNKPLRCDKCNYTSTQKGRMESHIASHGETDTSLLNCSHCSFTSTSLQQLSSHISSSHGEKASLSCSSCNFKTSQKSRLESHILARHVNKNPFKCDKCRFSTDKGTNLKKHNQTAHHKPKKYKSASYNQCPLCDYRTKQLKRFNDHFDSVHPFQSQPPPSTNKSMPSSRARKRKFESDSPTLPPAQSPPSSDQPQSQEPFYQCNECNFKATHRKVLKSHILDSH